MKTFNLFMVFFCLFFIGYDLIGVFTQPHLLIKTFMFVCAIIQIVLCFWWVASWRRLVARKEVIKLMGKINER